RHSMNVRDPLWRLPLWRGYEKTITSSIADLNNSPDYSLAGAITAALFLNRFVGHARSWVHIDIPAWTDRPRPGRPGGAEANSARALYALLSERYPTKGKDGTRSRGVAETHFLPRGAQRHGGGGPQAQRSGGRGKRRNGTGSERDVRTSRSSK